MLPFKNQPKSLLSGMTLISKGWSFARADRLTMIYSLIPIFISICFLYFGFEYGYSYIRNFLFSFTIEKISFDFFAGFLILWIAKLIFKILSVLLVIILSYVFLQILYIPFYSFIAERVLKKKFNIELKNQNVAAFLSYTLRMLKVGLLKSLLFLIIALLCFALSFIPPLGFLPLYFGLFVIAYDAFDYSLEILDLSLSERLDFIKKEIFMINGHTLILGLLSFLPGVIFLMLPFAVAGGAITVGEMNELNKKDT